MKIKNITDSRIKAGSIIYFRKGDRFYEGILKEDNDPFNFQFAKQSVDSQPITFKGRPKEILPKYTSFKRGDFVLLEPKNDKRVWIAKVTKKPYKNPNGAWVYDAKLVYIKIGGEWEAYKPNKNDARDWWKANLCYDIDKVLTREEVEKELFCEVL